MTPDPRKKEHFDITYKTPDGTEHKIRGVHQHLVSDIAVMIALDKRFYDVRIDGRILAEHREIYGGRVIREEAVPSTTPPRREEMPFHVGDIVHTPRGIGKVVGANPSIVTVFGKDFGEVIFGVEAIKKVQQ